MRLAVLVLLAVSCVAQSPKRMLTRQEFEKRYKPVAYTVHLRSMVTEADGTEHHSSDQIISVGPTGIATKSVIGVPEPRSIMRQVHTGNTILIISDRARAKSTITVPDAGFAAIMQSAFEPSTSCLKRIADDFQVPGSELAGEDVIAGFKVHKIAIRDKEVSGVLFRAPELGCASLGELWTSSDGKVNNRKVLASVVPSDDESLFENPSTYAEMKPSSVGEADNPEAGRQPMPWFDRVWADPSAIRSPLQH